MIKHVERSKSVERMDRINLKSDKKKKEANHETSVATVQKGLLDVGDGRTTPDLGYEADEEDGPCCFGGTAQDDSASSEASAILHRFEVVMMILLLITYVADTSTDICLAVIYGRNRDWLLFGLTLTFILLPNFVLGATVFCLSLGCACVLSCFPVTLIFIIGTPGILIIIYLDNIFEWISEEIEEHAAYDSIVSASIRLVQGFSQAAPQMVLQLFFIVSSNGHTGYPEYVLWLTVGTSLVSISLAIVSFEKSERSGKPSKQLMPNEAVSRFLWRIFSLGVRVLSFALFTAYRPYGVLIVAGLHWVTGKIFIHTRPGCKNISVAWPLSLKANKCCNNFGMRLVEHFVQMLIIIFSVDMYRGENTDNQPKYIFFYILTHLENAAMLLAWYITSQMDDTYRNIILAIVTVGSVIGCFIEHLSLWIFNPHSDTKKKDSSCLEGNNGENDRDHHETDGAIETVA